MAEGIDHFHNKKKKLCNLTLIYSDPLPTNELVRRLMKRQEIEVIRYRNRDSGTHVKKFTAVNRG